MYSILQASMMRRALRVRPIAGTDAVKKKRFTEEQFIGILREQEAGAKVADPARKYAVSEATLYNWKAKFGGMDASEAKRLEWSGPMG